MDNKEVRKLPDLVQIKLVVQRKAVILILRCHLWAANNQEFSFYPIPTEDKGTLTFTNGQDDIVTVDLLDINGRRVAVLIDNQAFVAGQHKVSTSFNEIPSGIYYVKFTSLYEVKTLKVVDEKELA